MGAGPPMGAGANMPVEQEVMQLLELRTQIDERLSMLTGAPPPGGDPAMMDPAMAGGMPAGPPMAPQMAAPMPPPGGLLG